MRLAQQDEPFSATFPPGSAVLYRFVGYTMMYFIAECDEQEAGVCASTVMR
jgi:hypothetical protein